MFGPLATRVVSRPVDIDRLVIDVRGQSGLGHIQVGPFAASFRARVVEIIGSQGLQRPSSPSILLSTASRDPWARTKQIRFQNVDYHHGLADEELASGSQLLNLVFDWRTPSPRICKDPFETLLNALAHNLWRPGPPVLDRVVLLLNDADEVSRAKQELQEASCNSLIIDTTQ